MRFLGIISLRPLNAAFDSESKEVDNRTSWSSGHSCRFGGLSIPLPSSKSNPVAQAAETQRRRNGAPCIVGALRGGSKLWDVIDPIILRNNRSQASCVTCRTLSLGNMGVYNSKGPVEDMRISSWDTHCASSFSKENLAKTTVQDVISFGAESKFLPRMIPEPITNDRDSVGSTLFRSGQHRTHPPNTYLLAVP